MSATPAIPEGEHAPFVRFDTLASRSPDGTRTLYLDHDAFAFSSKVPGVPPTPTGPRTSCWVSSPKPLKDQEILGFLGSDPERITAAIAQLSSSP